MRSFFKVFFASFLAVLVFSLIVFFILLALVSGLMKAETVNTGAKAVLVLDLSKNYAEIPRPNPVAALTDDEIEQPSLRDVVQLLHHAKSDSSVKGIFLQSGSNANGLGSSEDIRNALLDFKASGKFIMAYGDVISQRAYQIANVADRIYCNPKGGVDWRGYSLDYFFLKNSLEKLEIEPQIFYAGKFKSATEPFRETKMTEANRLQSTELLNELYSNFLQNTSVQRKIDTASLRRMANQNLIRFAKDAVTYRLVDGMKYDDEVKNEIKQKLGVGKFDRINFISISKYSQAVNLPEKGRDRLAIIYAGGDIIEGRGQDQQIGSDTYVSLIRKIRLDKHIKAIVLRINSGGGSALASENILRELMLAQEDKPVVVSFGDVAASGAYYLSSNADSIFAQPNTITGSIGVFAIIPNMQGFFKNKLGVTFDGVKTATYADAQTITRPLTGIEKEFMQQSVDTIYQDFIGWVSKGRRLDRAYVDSIGQGRIWSGTRALKIGLVDRIGGLEDAIQSAAAMAKLKEYRIREYPEHKSFLQRILGDRKEDLVEETIRKELGEENFKTYKTISSVKQVMNGVQTRMPFDINVY